MILYVATDAGPARYIATLINAINFPFYCLCSEISWNVFEGYGIKATLNEDEIDYEKIRLVITGTCLNACKDKTAIRKAKNLGIPSISIIEHWSLYKERFLLDDKLCLPDYIFVNDDIAMKEAIQSGLPQDKLYISGNPYLEGLSKRELFPMPKDKWLQQYNLKMQPTITFISETYHDDFPQGSENYPGFDEYEVLNTLVEISNENKYNLLIREHPSDCINKYHEYLTSEIVLEKEKNFDSVIMNSDFIIGMGSMFLLEASLFRKDIISYRPNERYPFIGNLLGMTTKAKGKSALCSLLQDKEAFHKERKYNFVEGSVNRINTFLNNLLYINENCSFYTG